VRVVTRISSLGSLRRAKIYGNALQAASFGGHEKVVALLLEKSAAVDAQGGHYGKALQAASLAT
jgi:hypothetical protein